ncbi:unnamed protein product [Calypogeia fissa]
MDFLSRVMVVVATCVALVATAVSLKRRNKLLRLNSEIPAEAGQVPPVNASVYILYKPASTPTMEVLFFHGFQRGNYEKAHLSAWKCGDGHSIWPTTWLVERFCGARILTLAYNAVVMKRQERQSFDMYNMVENLADDLLEAGIGQNPCCPVVLVGHSFGGLVIKQLCVYASSQIGFLEKTSQRGYKLNSLLENIKGVFFYSTPHYGIADNIAEHFVENLQLLAYVKTLSTVSSRLNHDFEKLCGQSGQYKKWQIAGVGESLPTKLGGFCCRIVEEASSRYSAFNIVEGADHISVCRPSTETSRSFYALTNFLEHIPTYSKPMVNGLPTHATALERRAFEVQVQLLLNLPDYPTTFERQSVQGAVVEHNCLVLGIVGMGGIGKTTIAREVFNNISGQFEYTCFVDNVKGIKAHKLNDWILHHFLRNGKQVNSLQWSDLQLKKTLITMDDVDSEDQVRTLPRLDQLGNGSRLIFTSRDRGVFDTFPKCFIYDVEFLRPDEAKKLFCKHAFEQEDIPEVNRDLEEDVKRVVSKCDGLPLTLEVMGSYLRNHKTKSTVWKETVRKLENAESISGVRKDRVWTSLKLSYEGLSPKEQRMFIEAGTYFFQQPVEQAVAAWSTAYDSESGWANLLRTSMVKEVKKSKYDQFWEKHIEYKEVWVHENMRNLASSLLNEATVLRSVAGENIAKDVFNADLTNMLRLEYDTYPDETLNYPEIRLELLDKLENLTYLELGQVFPSGSSKNLPRKLALLKWTMMSEVNVNMLKKIPPTLSITLEGMNTLAVLELSGCKMLGGAFAALGELRNLRILSLCDIQGPTHLPESFGNLPQLKRLTLQCLELTTLPDSFGNLKALEHLALESVDILNLPESFGELSSLATLVFNGCEKLASLPESFGRLSSLTGLRICDCSVLNCEQATQFDLHENLSSLTYLSLKRCTSLERLPVSFGLLLSLEALNLEGCVLLKSLPEKLGESKALKTCVIDRARHLKALPDSFGNLAALTWLHLNECESLESLPTSFGNLSALEELELRCCRQLQRLPDNFGQLRALERLTISVADQLRMLSDDFGKLTSLTNLKLEECPLLGRLPESFGLLCGLHDLTLRRCRLQKLPENFCQLVALRRLMIDQADNVDALAESMGNFSALQELYLENCDLPQTLYATFSQLRALESMTIRKAHQLEALCDDFGKLTSLTYLRLEDCPRLERLPESFALLSALQRLIIREADNLEALPESFGLLPALQQLGLTGCNQLQRLPENFGQLKALKRFWIRGADQLEELVDNLGNLSSLELLKIGARRLQKLPESVSKLSALRELSVWAPSMSSVSDELGDLSSLEILQIGGFPTLETLPDSVGRISSLRVVILQRCSGLKSLPDSFGKFFWTNGDGSTGTTKPVGGQSSQVPSSQGFRLHVEECELLDDSALRGLGWIQSDKHDYNFKPPDPKWYRLRGKWYQRKQPAEEITSHVALR